MFNKLAQEVFQVLKGSGKTLTLFNTEGAQIYKPEEARKFFAEPENFVISINDNGLDSSISMYLSNSANISQDTSLRDLIDTLRSIATRHNILFNVRKYAKELKPKDFAYQAEIKEGINMEDIKESKLPPTYGSTKTSYQKIGETRLIIRHTEPVKEGVHGSRSRNIRSIFIENAAGERFLYPTAHLAGARSMAIHISNNGKMSDDIGKYIINLSEQYIGLSKISTHIIKNRSSLDESVNSIRNDISGRAKEIRLELAKVVRNYSSFSESYQPTTLVEGEENSNEITRLATLLNLTEGSDEFDALTYAAPYIAKTSVVEEPEPVVAPDKQDPFTTYATQWLEKTSRSGGLSDTTYDTRVQKIRSQGGEVGKVKNTNDVVTGIIDKRYNKWDSGDTLERREDIIDLSNGLRAISTGKMPKPPALPKNVKFKSPEDEYRIKIISWLKPETKLSPALSQYISYLGDKLSDGKKLTPNEKHFADKLASSVGVKEGFVEEHDLEEWFEQFDPKFVLKQINENQQYTSLNDVYPDGNTEIWYAKDDYFRDLSLGLKFAKEQGINITPDTISQTHVLVGTVAETDPNKIFHMMQGEMWSPNGEARAMIGNSAARHTSMSVGDVIATNGRWVMVDRFGFSDLNSGEEIAEGKSYKRNDDEYDEDKVKCAKKKSKEKHRKDDELDESMQSDLNEYAYNDPQGMKSLALQTLNLDDDAVLKLNMGMSKEEAREYLLSIGYTPEQISSLEGDSLEEDDILGGDLGDDLIDDITFDINGDLDTHEDDEIALSKQSGVIENDEYNALQNLRRLSGI